MSTRTSKKPQILQLDEEKKTEVSSISDDLNHDRIPGTSPNDKSMDITRRIEIAASIGEECIGLDKLEILFDKKLTRPIAYDGFEPSGRMHIAQGILKAINVNKLTSVGCDFVFWIADWFALLNNKMDGDIDKIRIVGRYMIEVWKAAGMDMEHVYFRWCSDDINNHSNEYWLRVIEISKMFSITRTKRCCTILGREQSDDMPTANLLYACMQCSDIFFLKADICQLGMDQRKVNMLARKYAEKKMASTNNKKKKKKKKEIIYPPVILSHHMLMGLKQEPQQKQQQLLFNSLFLINIISCILIIFYNGSNYLLLTNLLVLVSLFYFIGISEPKTSEIIKMSKSDPNSAIFMEDTADDVRRKIKNGYCPPGVIERNPILDYTKHLVFGKFDTFKIERSVKHGGTKVYKSYKELEQDYVNEVLHPGDLKPALAKVINEMIEPIRQHFKNDKNAKQIFAKVKQITKKLKVTR